MASLRQGDFFSVMYHYVRPEESSRLRYLSLDAFLRQLDFFSTNYGLVSQAQWESFLQNKTVPSGALLTFDDGLVDHFDFVAPELEKRGLFGIFYVNTDPLEGRPLSVHLAHYLLANLDPNDVLRALIESFPDSLEALDRKAAGAYKDQDHTEIEKSVKRLVNWAVELSSDHRDGVERIFHDLTGMTNAEFIKKWYLTREQITHLSRKFEVGSHSRSHRLLSRLTVEDQINELVESKNLLESLTSVEIRSFCFPYGGKESYSNTTVEILESAGYTNAISVEPLPINNHCNPHELPRYDCNLF